MLPPDDLPDPPIVVLDTNVVLDWLVFRHAASLPLHQVLETGRLRWVATAAMWNELAHVLSRDHLAAWKPDSDAVWSAWQRHCREQAVPAPLGPAGALRCTDPDDQMFIDLAVACDARWLISRDRAVLKLAPRLRGVGVEALTPEAWIARACRAE